MDSRAPTLNAALTALTAEDVLEHAEWVRRLAVALVRDPAEADDLAQATWEAVLGRPPREPGPLRPWLAGVVRNLARMRARGGARRRRREEAAEARPAGATTPSPAELVERVRTQQWVARCVLELPPPLRETVLLRYYEGYSSAEIARRLDIPAGTVRWRLKQGLDQLRDRLDREVAGGRRQWTLLLAPLVGSRLSLASAPAGSAAGLATGALAMKPVVTALAIAVTLLAALWFGGRRAGWFGAGDTPAANVTANAAAAAPAGTAAAPSAAPRTRLAADDSAMAASRDDDPIGELRLEGQVIDGNDEPVPGAVVAIDTNPPRSAVTEADGSFAFDRLIGRDYAIEARADGLYASHVYLRLTADTEPVILRALPAGALRVVVVDAVSNDAIAGAQVELRSQVTWTAVTGEDGVAELRGVGGTMLVLRVAARGYAPVAERVPSAGDEAHPVQQRVTLRRGARVSGRVLTRDGAPIAGARVVARAADQPFPVTDPRRDAVLSDADGRWQLPAVAAGSYRFAAVHPDYAPAETAPLQLDGERDQIELRMDAGGEIAGQVQTAAGEPVPGADVRVVARGSVPWRSARQSFSDDQGRFRITGLPRRAVDVVASHAAGASELAAVDLSAEPKAELSLVLALTSRIAGTVVDGEGRAVPEAQVVAEPEWSGAAGEHVAWEVRGLQMRIADSGGGFAFNGLPEGAYRLRAARPDAGEAAVWLTAGVRVHTGDRDVRLVAPAGARVRGRVLYEDGTAPPAFAIAIGATNAVPFASEDGRFALDAPGGTYNMVVSGPSFARKVVEASIDGDGDTDLGTIHVARGRSVSGRVIDSGGAPVPDATVAAGALLTGDGQQLYIEDESINARSAQTDADGRFGFEGFGEGQLTIVAGKPGSGRSDSLVIPPGAASVELDLVLQATGALEGRVTRDGAPVAETVIIANPAGATGSAFFVITGADGSFALDQLSPGDWVVYPMIGGGGARPKDMFVRSARVEAGARARADIEIQTGDLALVIETVTDAGEPVPAAMLFLLAAEFDTATLDGMRRGSWAVAGFGVDPIGFYTRMAMGAPARVEGLRPGPHTACAVPLPIDPSNPLAAARVRERMGTLPFRCAAVPVAAAPREQRVRLAVPAEWTKAEE